MRYLGSEFLGHATAADLLTHFKNGIRQLDPKRLLQVSMDAPSVNWKFYTDLARERKTQQLPSRPSQHRQLKSHGTSFNCHGKVMELYHLISVGTLNETYRHLFAISISCATVVF